MNDERLALALDRIERREARLLAWGITDRGLTEEDLEELLSPVADGDLETLLSELKNHGLIFEVPRSYPAIYRSRMAEGVRLFSQLRQWWRGRSWGDAAPLVADYRFLVQPRLFPERSLSLEDVQQRHHPSFRTTHPVKRSRVCSEVTPTGINVSSRNFNSKPQRRCFVA